ncbi:unnamed protein product [Eruca vesicaria subsp. sativa]|uniref:Uncharacterized protein n=1 Tax=Eruca vesicaria subsp. sativa TaxID=29727 RepID=A0ABC8IUS3_ERUVS|nr:unnamed protein product [Eruca vesicaria subsp. sativa]
MSFFDTSILPQQMAQEDISFGKQRTIFEQHHLPGGVAFNQTVAPDPYEFLCP